MATEQAAERAVWDLIRGGDVAALRAALDAGGAGLVEAPLDKHGSTAFLIACFYGQVECMDVLQQAGCDVSAINEQGRTGLHMSVAKGHVATVRWILDAGPELEARDKPGCTAFLLACIYGQVECMEVLQQAGCDVSATDDKGRTGLHMSAVKGQAAAVRWMLDAEAELDARDKEGSTAFLAACFYGQVECMDVLQQAGCDVSAINIEDQTGLHASAAGGHVAAARWMLDAEVELEARDKQGSTAFLRACFCGQVECMQTLKDAGCDVLCTLPDGRTATDLAKASGNEEAIFVMAQFQSLELALDSEAVSQCPNFPVCGISEQQRVFDCHNGLCYSCNTGLGALTFIDLDEAHWCPICGDSGPTQHVLLDCGHAVCVACFRRPFDVLAATEADQPRPQEFGCPAFPEDEEHSEDPVTGELVWERIEMEWKTANPAEHAAYEAAVRFECAVQLQFLSVCPHFVLPRGCLAVAV